MQPQNDQHPFTGDIVVEANRHEVIKLLNEQLANTLDLSILLQRAYWGSSGCPLTGVRKLLRKVAGKWPTLVGRAAQVIRTLGGQPLDTPSMADHSSLPDYPQEATTVQDRIYALRSIYSRYQQITRASLKVAQAMNCNTAIELLREAKRRAERDLCSLEACLKTLTIGSSVKPVPMWSCASNVKRNLKSRRGRPTKPLRRRTLLRVTE